MQDNTKNITYHTPDIFVGETEKKSPTFSDDVNVAVSVILDLSQKSLHNFNQKAEFIKKSQELLVEYDVSFSNYSEYIKVVDGLFLDNVLFEKNMSEYVDEIREGNFGHLNVFFLDLINQFKTEIENFNQTKDFQRIIGFLADLDVLLLMLPKFFGFLLSNPKLYTDISKFSKRINEKFVTRIEKLLSEFKNNGSLLEGDISSLDDFGNLLKDKGEILQNLFVHIDMSDNTENNIEKARRHDEGFWHNETYLQVVKSLEDLGNMTAISTSHFDLYKNSLRLSGCSTQRMYNKLALVNLFDKYNEIVDGDFLDQNNLVLDVSLSVGDNELELSTQNKLKDILYNIIQDFISRLDDGEDSRIPVLFHILHVIVTHFRGIDLSEFKSFLKLIDKKKNRNRGLYFSGEVDFSLALLQDLENALLSHEKLEAESISDSLTGLNNRGKFQNKLEEKYKLFLRNKNDFCIIYLDLDGFKGVNDNLGHAFGDEILVEFGSILQENFQRENDFIARLGGDEFAVMIDGKQSDIKDMISKVGKNIYNRLNVKLSEKLKEENKEKLNLELSVSLGVNQVEKVILIDDELQEKSGKEVKTLIDITDGFMYEAKKQWGKNCGVFSDGTVINFGN